VQQILGQAHPSATQRYPGLPAAGEVVENVLAFHDASGAGTAPAGVPAPGYRAETPRMLLGEDSP